MSTIVTRAGKGSPLTFDEVDANFTNLNTDKIQTGGTIAELTITNATINGGTITGITDLAIADGGTGASTAANARTNLGVAIGTNVQAYDSNLTSFVNTFTLPTTDGTANQVLKTDGAGTLSLATINTGDAYVGSTNTFTANQIISVTDNTNAALRVTQLGTGDAIRIEDSANPDASPFIIKNDGKVGIGITTPSYELEVSSAEPTARVYGTNASLASMISIANPSNAMFIGKDRNGSSGVYGSAGEYIVACNGAFPLDFYTNNTKAVRIDASQNVSFGDSVSVPSSLSIYNQNSSGFLSYVYNSASAIGGSLLRLYRARGTISAPTQVLADDTLGAIRGFGYQSGGAFSVGTVGIDLIAAENYTATNQGSYINFTTTPIGSTGLSRVERMRIDSTGSLILVGSTAQKATGTTWSNPSDIRLKDNVTSYPKGLNELMQVHVKEWTYNGKGGTTAGVKGLGVIADEVMQVLPNTVENYQAKLNEDDEVETNIKKFDATEITWLMLKSIQELKAIVDTQAQQIKVLQGVA